MKFKFHLIGLMTLVLFLNTQDLSAQNKYQGLLWEISGNGLSEPSHLYGTMHVSSKLAFNLGEPFFTALGKSKTVALEMDPELWFDEVLGGDFMSSALRMNGSKFNPYDGNGSAWNDLQGRTSYEKRSNQMIQDIFKGSPEMINQLLFRFYDPTGNFEEDTWLDMFIYQSAKKLGKKTLGLETFYESMDMMYKAQKEMAKNPDKQSDLDYQDRIKALSDIEDSYRRGNLDLLDSLSTLVNPSSFTKYILIERNKNFIKGMDTLMHKGPMFIGVGAAHLPGKEGCIEMLRSLGYTVNPVNAGSRDLKTKDKLTELNVKRPMQTYTSADGQISFSTPAETYAIVGSGKSLGYISMDITNGLTFILDRVLTDNALRKLSPEQQIQSFDSLLYETIPGDIIKKKKVMIQSYPAYDILHKVGRGDYNRSMIVFTEYEVIIGRLSASGEKVKKGAGDHFFSTLKLDLNHNIGPLVVEAPYGTFSAQFHGRVTSYSLTKENRGVKDMFIQSVDGAGDVFLLHRLQAEQGGYIEDERYFFYKANKAFQKDHEVDEVAHSFTKVNERQVMKAEYEERFGKKVYGYYVVSGDEIYALHVYTQDEKKAETFFSSLNIAIPTYPESFEYTDSSAFFSSRIPWLKENAEIDKLMSRDPYDDPDSEGNSEYYYTSTLSPPGSSDYVQVYYYRYPSYFYVEDKVVHEEELDKDFTDDDDVIIESKEFTWNEKGYVADYILGDSLSDYKYAVHRQLDGNRLFTVTAGYDAKLGLSPLYIDFLAHLTLLEDSLNTGSILELDSARLLDDLMSADTVKFKNANETILNSSSFPEKVEFDIFSQLVQTPAPLATEKDEKKYLGKFNKLRYLSDTDSTLNVLKEDYRSHEDSALYQREILGTIVHFKTRKAVSVAKDLLINDAPIGIRTSLYDSFFSSLGDSLELSAAFFPEILELLDYEEYKDPVLLTLNLLLDSAALDHKIYASKLPYLIKQAKQETKRLSSTGYEFDYDEEKEFYREMKIHHYWNLLYPFKKEAEVKEVYEMAETSSLKELQKSISHFRMKKGEEISDGRCKELTEGKDLLKDQLFLFAMKKESLFPDSVDLIELYLTEQIKKQWRTGNSDWDTSKIDSILVISTQDDTIRTHVFTTYYIKSLKSKDGDSDWQMHVVMVDKDSQVPNLDFIHSTDEYSRNKTEEEQFDEMRNILIANNRRYPFRSYEEDDWY